MRPTLQRLCKSLAYNPDTGLFTRRSTGKLTGSVCARGYIRLSFDGKNHRAHRLAWFYMTGYWPTDGIDHVNGIKTDNRWINLRHVSQSDNNKNSKLYSNSKTGITGISWNKSNSKWLATIQSKNKRIFLGYFDNFVDAVISRLNAEKEHSFHENHGRVEMEG